MRLLVLALFVINLSCQTKPKEEAQTTSTTATALEDSAATLSKRPSPDAPRTAADRLIRALYFEHNKKENPMRETKDRALVDQFFAKPVGDLIWNDVKKASSQLNRSRTNLLFNAPDAAIKKTWVLPAVIGGSRAIVYVTFENKAKPEEVRVDLKQVAGRWRIIDMLYPNGQLLTQLLH